MTTSAQVRPWIERIENFVPAWLQNRPEFVWAHKVIFTHALISDRATQVALEGVRAGFPGYDARTDNLALLGESRGLRQGETETADDFAVRLQGWIPTGATQGSDIGLATQLHEWIAGDPMIRVIDRCNPSGKGARYTTIDTSGTVTQVYAPFDWDSVSNPERAHFWWDFWIVVYPTASGFYLNDCGVWGHADSGAPWNPVSGWGHNASVMPEVDTIRGIVKLYKGEHANCRSLIWVPPAQSALFDPAAPALAGNPDGTWGKWFNPTTLAPSRNRALRYWSLGAEVT